MARRTILLLSETRDRGSEMKLEAVTIAAQRTGITIYAATYSAIESAFASKLQVGRPRRALKPKTPNDNMGTVDGGPARPNNPKHLPPEQQVDLLATIGEIRHLHRVNDVLALAAGTGGAIYPFAKEKTLEEAIKKLGGELHSQYVLSFVPEVTTAGYHTLAVKLARQGEWQIRARPGYWSLEEARREDAQTKK